MYATGYGIHPLRSRRASSARHVRLWALVVLAVIAFSVVLAKVALGGSVQTDATVVVQPGDTLWGIATARYPTDDVRVRVDEIERLNGLRSPQIEAGETLLLPA